MNPYLLVNLNSFNLPNQIQIDSNRFDTLTIRKLSHKSQVICALSAAKMVLPIWEKYNKFLTNKQKEAPKIAIAAAEKWIKGNSTLTELTELTEVICSIANASCSAVAVHAYNSTIAFNAALSTIFNPYRGIEGAVNACINTILRSSSSGAYVYVWDIVQEWWEFCKISLKQNYDNLCEQISGGV